MTNSDNLSHSDHARAALLRGVAAEFAETAANTLEPLAGTPIDRAARDRLATDVHRALVGNMPALVNVLHALDAMPPAI